MKHLNSSEVTRQRTAKWIMEAKPVDKDSTWVERRLAIDFGGKTYLLTDDQTFQCPHCGRYDPQWTVEGVREFFEEHFGVKAYEIEIECSVAKKVDE